MRLIEGKYGGLPDPPGSQPLAVLSPVPLTDGRPAAPLLPLTVDAAINPAAFDAWFVQQDTFDRDDRNRHDLHAVRCSVARILGHKPDVARDQLQVRLSGLAAGRPLSERPRRDDELQAARELQELRNNRVADIRRPANESQQPTLIGGVA